MIKQNVLFIVFLTLSLGVVGQNKVNQFDENGKRHGPWKKYFDNTNNLRYEGQFEHGKEVGVFKYYQKLGKISTLAATKEFNKEDNSAFVTFYSIAGKKISEGKMIGKKYVGPWVYYHKNSDQVMTKEFYDNEGNLDGVRQVFYKSGQLAQETNYIKGKREGEERYYALNGTVIKLYHYENDQLHGKAKHFDDNGQLIMEGQYKRDKKTGWWKTYANGELVDQKDHTYKPKYKKKN